MIHKRKIFKNREIETFEHTPNYYIQSFVNGNKSHVAEELSELLTCSIGSFISILIELPKKIQTFVLNSNFYQDAELHLILKQLKK